MKLVEAGRVYVPARMCAPVRLYVSTMRTWRIRVRGCLDVNTWWKYAKRAVAVLSANLAYDLTAGEGVPGYALGHKFMWDTIVQGMVASAFPKKQRVVFFTGLSLM